MGVHDSIGWRQLVDQNINNRFDISYNPVQVQNNNSAEIVNAILGFGLGFGTMYAQASAEQRAQNEQVALQTAQIFNAYSTQKAAIATAEAELANMEKESAALTQNLKDMDNADELAGMADSTAKNVEDHQNAYKDDAILKQYNELNSQLTNLKDFKNNQVKTYNDTLAQKQKDLSTAKAKPTTGSASHANTSFSLTGTAGGGAVAQVEANRDKYKQQVKGADGKYTQQFNQAGFDDDLKTARDLDANAKDIAEKEKALKDHEATKNNIKCTYGNGQTATIDNIDPAISEVSQQKAALEQQSVSGSDGTTTTVGQYNTKLGELQKKADHYADLKTRNKETVKNQRDALDAKIAAKKEEIAAAKKQLAQYQQFVDNAQFSADRIAANEQKLADAKASVKTNKMTGKDGKKRTWWQRLWGTNRSDALKTARQERREARFDLRQDTQAQISVYGRQVDADYLKALKETQV